MYVPTKYEKKMRKTNKIRLTYILVQANLNYIVFIFVRANLLCTVCLETPCMKVELFWKMSQKKKNQFMILMKTKSSKETLDIAVMSFIMTLLVIGMQVFWTWESTKLAYNFAHFFHSTLHFSEDQTWRKLHD